MIALKTAQFPLLRLIDITRQSGGFSEKRKRFLIFFLRFFKGFISFFHFLKLFSFPLNLFTFINLIYFLTKIFSN